MRRINTSQSHRRSTRKRRHHGHIPAPQHTLREGLIEEVVIALADCTEEAAQDRGLVDERVKGVFGVEGCSGGDEVEVESLGLHGGAGDFVVDDVHLHFCAEFVGVAGDWCVGVVEGCYGCGEDVGTLGRTDGC